jgi:hypothetical protein
MRRLAARRGLKLLQGSSNSQALIGLSHDERLHGRGGNDLLGGGR